MGLGWRYSSAHTHKTFFAHITWTFRHNNMCLLWNLPILFELFSLYFVILFSSQSTRNYCTRLDSPQVDRMNVRWRCIAASLRTIVYRSLFVDWLVVEKSKQLSLNPLSGICCSKNHLWIVMKLSIFLRIVWFLE